MNKELSKASPGHSVQKSEDAFGKREVQESTSTATEMVAAQTRSEVEAGFILAQKCPRNEELARANVISSCKSIRFAEKAMYAKPVGETKIEGLSIRFAEELARCWGNVKVFEYVLHEHPLKRLIRVVVYDLQTNMSYTEDLVIDKTVERKYYQDRVVIDERINSRGQKIAIVEATEDEVRNKQKSAVSKAIRNQMLRLVPSHVKEDAIDAIKATIKGGIDKDPMAVKRKMIDSFSTLGIDVKEIEQYLKHPIDQTTTDEMMELQSIYNSIKDGEARWSDYLKVEDAEVVDEKTDEPKTEVGSLKPGDPDSHTAVDAQQKPQTWEDLEKQQKADESTKGKKA